MLSLIKYVAQKAYGLSTGVAGAGNSKSEDSENAAESPPASLDPEELADTITGLLHRAEEIRAETVEPEEAPLNFVEEDEVGCIYAHGTVSLVHNSYVLIENRYMCEMKYVVPADLRKGDRVHYMAYKASKGEELKVRKILSKVNAGLSWEQQLGINDGETEPDEWLDDGADCSGERAQSNGQPQPKKLDLPVELYDENQPIDAPAPKFPLKSPRKLTVLNKRQMCKRVHVGKVDRRTGREIYLEDNTLINLDKVAAEFVPVVGDWVQLDCLVEINEDVINLKGEILEIEQVRPSRTYNKIGIVTEYNQAGQFGVVDKSIVFNKLVCLDGYLPCVGDKVVVVSIESDQGLQMRWRALTILPIEDVPNKYEMSAVKFEPQLPADQMKELLEDKGNIEITKDISVTLDVKDVKIIEVTIKNNGNFKRVLRKCSFLSRRGASQLTLIMPDTNDPITLKPEDETTYIFKCKAKFVGVTTEMIIFKFKEFKIGRIIEITVNSINNSMPQKESVYNGYKFGQDSQSVVPQIYEDGMYIKGVKPYKPAKFIPVRPVTWKIPPVLWATMDIIIQERKTRTESEFLLQEKIPCLNKPLSFDNYKQRFNYLLYLEEIAMVLDMRKFGMDSAAMHRREDYLTLNVPGLAEKRPSLIIGDRVVVYFRWAKESKHYEGYIHKIKSSDVYLKFNAAFHESYNGEDCQVTFKSSTTVLQRCHAAIGAVTQSLGSDFLFPRKVEEKEPQYNFVEAEEESEEAAQPKLSELSNEEDRLKLIESIIYKRKLRWFNKKLNRYQKEAVKNILKGVARPLPYVIFGPPGTGKTITVVESILQIYFTISESRILIATPSNSSANLIAERLLDARVLQPGDLVRLVAYHYLDSDQIPEKLLPFCVTADIAEEGTRNEVNLVDPRGCQTQVTLRTLCRHRIIIGTCSALGILYNMGCKPGHFTHLFVDEAGQASEPEVMIPLSLAHKSMTQVVLAGDPKQLGPINQSRLAGYFGLNDSFLVRLLQQFPYQKDPEGFETGYDPRLVTKLLMNYRSLPDLLALPNKLFYDNELIPQIDPENSKEAELLESLSEMLPKRLGAPPSVVFHCVYGTNMQDPDSPSWYNPEEATQIYIYLLTLYNHGLKPDDIGIITPYSKQVFNVRNLLAHLEIEAPKVGSVEEFQGQERKVILLSTVRTSEEKVRDDVRHSLGFVSARERLNVAITRARALLIIIGHPKLLQQDVYWRSVLEHCNSRSSVIGLELQ